MLNFFTSSVKNFIQVISSDVGVRDSAGKEVVSQIVPVVNASIALRRFYATANVGKPPAEGPLFWLAFKAEVPPLGFSTYVVTSSNRAGLSSDHCLLKAHIQSGNIMVIVSSSFH